MMADQSIGTEVPGAGEDKGSVRDVLGPDTEAGQAFLVAAAGAALLVLTVGAGQKGIVGKGSAVLGTVASVMAAVWVGNYLTRTWVVRHPNAPFAMGFHYDT